ncbi:type II and III secretion system protein, partial [Vibrio sp. F13]
MNPILMTIPLLLMLSGCISQDYLDRKENAESVQASMDQARSEASTPLGNVRYLSKPPANPTPIERNTAPEWLQERVRLKAESLPLSLVLSMLLDGTEIEVAFDPDVNPNTPVTLNAEASRQSLLNRIGSATRYGLTPQDKTLKVGYYQSETFTLTLPPGAMSGQQGSESESSGSGEEDDTQAAGQYLITTYDSVEVVKEVAGAVEAVLTDENESDDTLVGSVKVVPGLTALTVRTTPSRMAQARRVIASYQAELE